MTFTATLLSNAEGPGRPGSEFCGEASIDYVMQIATHFTLDITATSAADTFLLRATNTPVYETVQLITFHGENPRLGDCSGLTAGRIWCHAGSLRFSAPWNGVLTCFALTKLDGTQAHIY